VVTFLLSLTGLDCLCCSCCRVKKEKLWAVGI
jgi:hypothetical protein